jgi:hypothetical protein
MQMRTPIRFALTLACSIALAGLSVAPAFAGDDKMKMEETTTTTTTSTSTQGTVSQSNAGTIVIRSASSPNPIMVSKTTTYVDENGNPVAIETVKSGEPVTVFYDEDGGEMTATKVVVKKRMIEEDD